MNKRFYVILFCILSISVVLLGFSFSKESGSNDLASLAEINTEQYRTVFSNNKRLDTKENNSLDISVINKMRKEADYYLVLEEINNTSYDDLYYSIDGSDELKVTNSLIFLGKLNAYGKEGDQVSHNIKIISKNSEDLEFKLDIKRSIANSLAEKIKMSENIYQDEKNNYHFYGMTVDNYIKYQDDICRVMGVMDDNTLILCDYGYTGGYNDVLGRYLSIEEMLYSYGNSNEVSSNNLLEYESWMTEVDDFWLSDTYNNEAYYFSNDSGISLNTKNSSKNYRYVFELDEDTILIGGDGTKNNPYEVSYGS